MNLAAPGVRRAQHQVINQVITKVITPTAVTTPKKTNRRTPKDPKQNAQTLEALRMKSV